MKLDRIRGVCVNEFIARQIRARQPVIVTDAMDSWRALTQWTPEYFARVHGQWKVPVYGAYFDLRTIMRLGDYVSTYMGEEPAPELRYVRWFTLHQPVPNAGRFPWADEMFRLLRQDWAHPYFLPTSSYLFPFCSPEHTLDVPSDTTVPSKALYLSCAGAATNLHVDYWGSDAVLCQVYGQKAITMYAPDQADLMMGSARGVMKGTSGGRRMVDIRNPDLTSFPDFPKATPVFEDMLNPGEIVYIPSGWLHHVDTVSHSITLTWNFVHMASWRTWYRFLMSNPPESELNDIDYVLYDDPNRLQ